MLLALICNLETAFGAFKTKKLDRFDTKEEFLEFEEDTVLDASANDKYDLFIEVMIVGGNWGSGGDQKISEKTVKFFLGYFKDGRRDFSDSMLELGG